MHPILQRLEEHKLVQWALAYVAGAFALDPHSVGCFEELRTPRGEER